RRRRGDGRARRSVAGVPLNPGHRKPVRSRRGWAIALAAVLPSLCLAQSAPAGGIPDRIQQRLSEAHTLRQKGSLREAQKLYESVLPDLRARKTDLGSALTALTQIASALGDYDLALARGQAAAEVYRQLGDQGGLVRALNLLGAAEAYRGAYVPALARFEEALGLARARGDREAEVEELNNIGSVLFPQARYLDALDAYQAALDHVEAAAGAPWYARRKRITLSNLATVFLRLGAYD